MKAYARYLFLYQIVITLTDLSWMWLVAPWFLFPISGFLPTGPLTALGLPTEPQVVLLTAMVSGTMVTTGELFFQRQQSIVPGTSWMKLRKWQFHICHAHLIGWIIFQIALPSYVLQFNQCDRALLAEKYPTLRQIVEHPVFFCLSYDYIPAAARIVKFIIIMAVPILLILLCSSIFYLYKYDYRVSQRTRDMQKTMLKVLIIQKVYKILTRQENNNSPSEVMVMPEAERSVMAGT